VDTKISDGGASTDFSDLISLDWKAKDGHVGKNVKFSGRAIVTDENSEISDDSHIKG
jgi:hypothetical protein